MKLSHTAVSMYLSCGLCYKTHYIDNWRPIKTKSYFLFGRALDEALNELLKTKDIYKAYEIFDIEMLKDRDLDYSKNDLDLELLLHNGFSSHAMYPEWYTLKIKGQMMIKAYYNEILPKIQEVLVIQKPLQLTNDKGDEINGIVDTIVKMNGKTYLLDNKSSGFKYEEDSVKKSQQLCLYHYKMKQEYKLDGAGFIVLLKKINKNKVKKCKKCETINKSTHKTCNEREPLSLTNFALKRCNGEFDITINPTVDIQYIFDTISIEDEYRVLNDFNKANEGIKAGIFEKGPPGKFGPCTYFDIHDKGDYSRFKKKESYEKK